MMIQQQGQSLMALFNLNDKFAIGPGILLCGAAALLILCTIKGLSDVWRRISWVSLCMGGVCVYLSTNLFPWDVLGRLPVFSLLTVIQFPWRYTTLATICLIVALLSALAGAASLLPRHINAFLPGICVAVAVFSVMVNWSSLIPDLGLTSMIDTSQLSYTDKGNLAYPMDDLYLPHGAVLSDDQYLSVHPFSSVNLGNYTRSEGTVSVPYSEYLGQEGYVEFPLLYYPGYTVVEGEGSVIPSPNGLVGVVVPANSSGTLSVAFREPKRWLLADAVSACAAFVLVGTTLYRRHKEKAKAGVSVRPAGVKS